MVSIFKDLLGLGLEQMDDFDPEIVNTADQEMMGAGLVGGAMGGYVYWRAAYIRQYKAKHGYAPTKAMISAAWNHSSIRKRKYPKGASRGEDDIVLPQRALRGSKAAKAAAARAPKGKAPPKPKAPKSKAPMKPGTYVYWRSAFINGFKEENGRSPNKEEISDAWKEAKMSGGGWDDFAYGFSLPFKAASKVAPFVAPFL